MPIYPVSSGGSSLSFFDPELAPSGGSGSLAVTDTTLQVNYDAPNEASSFTLVDFVSFSSLSSSSAQKSGANTFTAANTFTQTVVGSNASFGFQASAGGMQVQQDSKFWVGSLARFGRSGTAALAQGDGGFKVRNLADSADGPLTCSSITLSAGLILQAITKANLLLVTPNTTEGWKRVTDTTPPQQGVFPDGTNWRYIADNSIVS